MTLYHWYLRDIEQETISGGFTIVTTTDVPCHMWLRHTLEEPQKHMKPVLVRGLMTMWDARFCFVVFEDLEQDEAGDTTTHTFTWTGWEVCQTRYFYFWATSEGEPMKSTSPIFSKHYAMLPPELQRFEWTHPDPQQRWWGFEHICWRIKDFKTLSNHTLNKLMVYLSQYGNPLPGLLRLYPTDNVGIPTGAHLFHIQFDWNGIAQYPEFTLVHFDVPDTNLVADQNYGICFGLVPPRVYPNAGRWMRGYYEPGAGQGSSHIRWSGDQGATWPGDASPVYMHHENWGYPL